MKDIIVTTSWDDGAIEDLKLLEFLNKYKLKGTFYISQKINSQIKPGKKLTRLSDDEIKKIAETQEIGAHSLNHIYFDQLNDEEIKNEINGSKQYLENLLGEKIKMFCYPGGKFNEKASKTVKTAGFLGARTTEVFKFSFDNPFAMATTIHCYPFPLRKDGLSVLLQPLLRNKNPILNLGLPLKSFLSWNNLAKCLFDYTLQNGGIFHLWGHSWEIEKNEMWDDLEKLFKYISKRPDVKYLTNSETLEFRAKNS